MNQRRGELYLDDPGEIADLAAEARAEGRVAIDAEFIRERTYYPQLALIQVATSRRSVLLDPVEGADLTPIEELVLDSSTTKVLHAATQDLEIFYHRTGEAARNIFDTQVAGSLAGLGHQSSYAAMIERTVGVALKKGESYTDWLRRPLTKKQEEYALDDVRYLHRAHDVLLEKLDSLGRRAWAEQEMVKYEDPTTYVTPPEDLYRKVKRFGTLDPKGLATLRELAIWREEEAMERDKPRRSIVADEVLVEMARSGPRSRDDLSRLRGLHPREAKRSADALLETIERGRQVPASERPFVAKRERLTPEAEAKVELLQAVLRALCRAEEVAPPVVASGGDVEELVRDLEAGTVEESGSALLRGWRRELVGNELIRFLEGAVSVHLDPKTGGPVFEDR